MKSRFKGVHWYLSSPCSVLPGLHIINDLIKPLFATMLAQLFFAQISLGVLFTKLTYVFHVSLDISSLKYTQFCEIK
jgi:hypothetical protein